MIVLPRDATPIDFAYAIHSDVGHTCVGAKVNGRIVPLRSTLRNGDIVEIMTQPGHEPSKDWLAFVKTSRARNKIKHVINASERLKAIEIGAEVSGKGSAAARRAARQGRQERSGEGGVGVRLQQDGRPVRGAGLRQVLGAPGAGKDRARTSSPEEAAGAGSRNARARSPRSASKESDAVIKVSGMDDLMVYRAKCCNPIRGEAIVGYVTRGKGVAVHSKMCPNVQNLMYDVERKIEVEWARVRRRILPGAHRDPHRRPPRHAESAHFRAGATKTQHPQPGSQDAISIRMAALVEMTVDVRDKKQLEKLVSAMRRISGVRDVERLLQLNILCPQCSTDRPRTHRHLQIERHQDRLEGRPSQRVRPRRICATSAPAPPAPARTARRRANRKRSNPFPMFKPTLKMLKPEPVGNYAIRINWSDGHSSGIYSYDHLRAICPCSECSK